MPLPPPIALQNEPAFAALLWFLILPFCCCPHTCTAGELSDRIVWDCWFCCWPCVPEGTNRTAKEEGIPASGTEKVIRSPGLDGWPLFRHLLNLPTQLAYVLALLTDPG